MRGAGGFREGKGLASWFWGEGSSQIGVPRFPEEKVRFWGKKRGGSSAFTVGVMREGQEPSSKTGRLGMGSQHPLKMLEGYPELPLRRGGANLSNNNKKRGGPPDFKIGGL